MLVMVVEEEVEQVCACAVGGCVGDNFCGGGGGDNGGGGGGGVGGGEEGVAVGGGGGMGKVGRRW